MKTLMIILQVIGLRRLVSGQFDTGYQYFKEEMQKRAAEVNISSLRSSISNNGYYYPQERYIDQPLDHFNTSDTRTFRMRYFADLSLWKDNGPIYFFIGGEAPADVSAFRGSIMYNLAFETSGAMFISEHRYYGNSMPYYSSNSYAEYYKYLSSQQALRDLVYLIGAIKNKNPKTFMNSKVVVIGCSYPGNLAAWMKLLYPDLVFAAVAGSAPVEAKKDFFEFIEHTGEMYKKYGSPECYAKIHEIFNTYDKLFQTYGWLQNSKSGMEICKFSYFRELTLLFMKNTMIGVSAIKGHCSTIMSSPIPSYLPQFVCYGRNELGIPRNLLQKDVAWSYQFCTEFGYIQTSNSDKQPFTKNVRLDLMIHQFCTLLFGQGFNEARIDYGVAYTNRMYGGSHPNVSKVIFVYGEVDSWSTLGVNQSPASDSPVIRINRASHCQGTIASSGRLDSPELIEAKRNIVNLIKKWIWS